MYLRHTSGSQNVQLIAFNINLNYNTFEFNYNVSENIT